MKNAILSIFITLSLLSCNNTIEENDIDHVVYDAFKALKNKDKEKFVSYFDLATINELNISEFNMCYNHYIAAVEKFELPNYKIWKKDKLFYVKDSINKIIRIGLPFISGATTGTPEYTFKIGYGEDLLLRGFKLNKTPKASELSDRSFPHKIDKFDFSTANLVSIRLYFLPGQNPTHESAKSVKFINKTLTENIIKDFESIFSRLDKSKIENASKVSITEELNTNDLRAILFDFQDGNEIVSLNIINSANQDKYLEINHFYVMNAAYKYELSLIDKTEMNTLLKTYIKKYLK